MRKFCCTVTYQYEIPDMRDWQSEMYDSVEEFKAARTCWKQCGIVEIEFDDQMNPDSMKLIRHVESQIDWSDLSDE